MRSHDDDAIGPAGPRVGDPTANDVPMTGSVVASGELSVPNSVVCRSG
jgi:hypothetical protein